jgi:hypothetical protein
VSGQPSAAMPVIGNIAPWMDTLSSTMLFGTVPLDPILQWREQLITNADVRTRSIANIQTLLAFEEIAGKIHDRDAWRVL